MSTLQAAVSPAVAVIGMACRFPGVDDIEAFWRALLRGDDLVSRVPVQRWDADAHLPYVSHGGFVGDIHGFDSAFFSVSDSEAAYICPQQRLLLELSWHVLEHAGVVPSALKNSDTGVFVGLCGHDFSILHWRQDQNLYLGTGTSNAVAANRISFQFGLHGPSFAVDAACSSSLVAVHLACRSIIAGECSQALAGSSNVLLIPEVTASLAQGGLISPEGRCKSFGVGADGYVRSEGAGMVMLKRLDLAERDGDRILGVIAASGMNHNGRSNGLTAPNSLAQSALIRKCIAQSGLQAAQIDYLEAAATGTRLGDAIEVKAIKDSLIAERGDAAPLTVGSVKSNIGHLEGTGGIAGLIKTLLCIQHGKIPASLHSAELNPLCQIDPRQLHVPQRAFEWQRAPQDRVAAVSSFGFGGSNAHLVVRGVKSADAAAAHASTAQLLPLSAQSPAALAALIESLRTKLDSGEVLDAESLAATAALSREHHRYRVAMVFEDRDELRAALADATVPTALQPQSLAFVLRGAFDRCAPQLAQLYACNPHFAATIDAADDELAGRLSLRDWLFGGQVDEASRPLLQLALDHCVCRWLAALLQSPLLFVGDGVGELAAAMQLLGIPLGSADAVLCGDCPATAWPASGKRLSLHVPASARHYAKRPWPWRSSLLSTLPDAQRCPVLDLATIHCADQRFPAELLRALYASGARLDWSLIHPPATSRHAALPLYPFQRTRHWPESVGRPSEPGIVAEDSGLTGETIALPLSDERRRRYRFDPAQSAVLGEHAIDGAVILSAAAQVALCAQALFDEFVKTATIVLADAAFLAPVYLGHGSAIEAQLLIQPATTDSGRCVLVAADSGAVPRWDVVFSAEYRLNRNPSVNDIPTSSVAFVPVAPDFYPSLAARGYHYGAGYRWLRERGTGSADRHFALANPDATAPAGAPWHPGLLDSCFHALALLSPEESTDTFLLPRTIDRIELRRPREAITQCALECHRHGLLPTGPHDLLLRDADGACFISLHAVRFGTVSRSALAALRSAAGAGAVVEAQGTHSAEALLKRTFDRVLGTAFAHEHLDLALPTLGIDSLKAMELRGYLWRTFRTDIGIAQLLGGLSFNTLLQQLSAGGATASHALNPLNTSAPAELDVVSFDDTRQDAAVEIEL